jgi:PAS domain S-box-containing protein
MSSALQALILAVVYVVVARLGLMLDAVAGFATLVWAPTGLSLAALLVFGYRLWPGVALGALVVNVWTGAPVAVALGIALGNTLEAVAGAYLLRRIPDFSTSLQRVRDVIGLMVRAAAASTLISATIGACSLAAGGIVSSATFGGAWRAWWLGDMIGDLVLAPVLLTWARPRATLPGSRRWSEVLLVYAVLIALGVLVFVGVTPSEDAAFGRAYLFFPPLLWAALRFSQPAATITTLLVSAIAIIGSAHGHGPFVLPTLSASLFALQIFMTIAAATCLLLAAVGAERRTAIESLERARGELAGLVEQRTHALQVAYTEIKERGEALRTAYDDLELRVQQRTRELSELNETLRSSEARKAAIMESALDCIVTMDEHGNIVDFNPAAEATFRLSREDAVGKELAALLIPEQLRQAHREGLARARVAGERHVLGGRIEFDALRSDGSVFPVELAVTAVRAGDGPQLFVAYVRDLTERKHAEQERALLEQRVQEGQKLESLGVLAGGIAHDFNNILMAVLGNASLARRTLPDDAHAQAHLAQIEEAARRATDLCRQMLAYAGKGRLVLQSTNLNRLIEETTHLLQVSISKKAVLRFHLYAELPSIIADATQMRQVLMNLVINASDAIGERSGVISITTGVVRADRTYLDKTFLSPEIPEGDYVFLEVSDTGVGMSAETQARIFEPFFSSKFAGRGLGLSATLGIVRGHKGAVKVYSELGKGSSFKFLLPVAAEAKDAEQPRPARRALPSTTGLILVVDDEETVRAVTSRMLEQLGFRVLTAADGREAQVVYREHKADISGVLMDLTMPHLDGEEAFRELRRIEPGVRVLLMSGYNEQDAIARFVGKGLAGFIQKPFNLDDLQEQLHKLLGQGAWQGS